MAQTSLNQYDDKADQLDDSAFGLSSQATTTSSIFTALLWGQGFYYLITGIWPLVSIESFQIVTGPKTDHLVTGHQADHWLVMTAGTLISAIGMTLLVAAWRQRNPLEIAVLAVASAAGLTAIDVIYVARQVIWPIYLADAAVEVVLIAAWCVVLIREFRASPARTRL